MVSEEAAVTEEGIVKWYSVAKGYGFIRRGDDAGADVFVHYSEIPHDGLEEGDRVSFELVDGPKGLKARKVQHADGPPN